MSSPSVTKGWNLNLNHVEAVVEIFAKGAQLDLCTEIPIGRGNQAHVRAPAWLIRADGLHFAGLREPQQHRLHSQTHLAEFVEEQSAAIRLTHEAHFVAIRAREAAASVSEQFRFQQGLGNAAAVDRDERSVGASAVRVNELRDHFFADARFTEDQHLGIRACRRGDGFPHLVDRCAFTEQGLSLGSWLSRRRRGELSLSDCHSQESLPE